MNLPVREPLWSWNKCLAIGVYAALGAIAAILLILMFTDVYLYHVLAFTLLGTGVLALIVRLGGNPGWYWVSSGCLYLFSTLAAFSIGLLTLLVPCVLLALALGHSFQWIATRRHALLLSGVGLLAWGILALTRGYWIFLPGLLLLNALDG